MKIRTIFILLSGLFMAACTDSTDEIGSSLTKDTDAINVETKTFGIASQSVLADSVLSRNNVGYLGKVRDSETGEYITGNFMAQFFNLEGYKFPDKSNMIGTNAQGDSIKGLVKADSCELRLFYSNHYGDSTRTMKLTAYEMGKPMTEDKNYYSDFDPLAEGYVREGGIAQDKVYTLTDYVLSESTRDTSIYEPYITVKLNGKYTDANGKEYDNYGTYILEKYYEHPEYFKNAQTFRKNVVPGFYFKHKSGLGNMAYIDASQLNISYKFAEKDSVMNGITVFWGTEEVLQTSNIANDKSTLTRLANDNSCTYLKTPSGIFTELTLPVEDIISGHENDNIAGAALTIPRINSDSPSTEYTFSIPENLLMIPKDSLYSFFENMEMYNNRTSFLATYTGMSSTNGYTFDNISNMITSMAAIDKEKRSADWNKVVLIPVSLTTTSSSTSSSSSYSYYYYYYYGSSSSSSSSTVTKVSHDMSLTSTKLVKGTNDDNSPLKLNVIYSRFK